MSELSSYVMPSKNGEIGILGGRPARGKSMIANRIVRDLVEESHEAKIIVFDSGYFHEPVLENENIHILKLSLRGDFFWNIEDAVKNNGCDYLIIDCAEMSGRSKDCDYYLKLKKLGEELGFKILICSMTKRHKVEALQYLRQTKEQLRSVSKVVLITASYVDLSVGSFYCCLRSIDNVSAKESEFEFSCKEMSWSTFKEDEEVCNV